MFKQEGLLIENDFIKIDISSFFHSKKHMFKASGVLGVGVSLLLFIVVGDGLYSHREDKNQILWSEDRSSSVFR